MTDQPLESCCIALLPHHLINGIDLIYPPIANKANAFTLKTAMFDNGTGIAFLALAWSGCIHAVLRTKSTCDHCSPVTFERRKPVSKLKRTMSARCGGNSAISL